MTKPAKREPTRPKGDYEVGYGRPPIASRFKPGEIGNPKGRSKQEKPVGQIIQDELKVRVTVEQNGRSVRMAMLTVIIRQLVRAAAKGDIKSIQALFNLLDRYQDSAATTFDPADLEPSDRAIIQEYVEQFRKSTKRGNLNTGDKRPTDKNGSVDNNDPSKDDPEGS